MPSNFVSFQFLSLVVFTANINKDLVKTKDREISPEEALTVRRKSMHKMVQEIVHVQVRQCGNQIGNAIWNTISAEHKLGKDLKFTGNKDDAEDACRLDKNDVKV